jgi:hypothetical protein
MGCNGLPEAFQREDRANVVDPIPERIFIFPFSTAFGFGHLSDQVGEHFVLFFKGLKDVPDFLEVRTGDGFFERLSGFLFQIEGNQDVTDVLGTGSSHGAAYGLDDVDLALLGREEGDHIDSRNIDTLGEASGIRHHAAIDSPEFLH